MMVLEFLDVHEWNKTEGSLKIGGHVTVNGEKAGEARFPGSFWAKVTSIPHCGCGTSTETYTVEVCHLMFY